MSKNIFVKTLKSKKNLQKFNKSLSLLFFSIFITYIALNSLFFISNLDIENKILKQDLAETQYKLNNIKSDFSHSREKIKSLEKSPGANITINPCSGSIALYKSKEYKFYYEFKHGYKEMKAVFTDSTGNLEINLLKRLSDDSNLYSGAALVQVFPEGEQGERFFDLEVYASDQAGNEYYFSCNYDLFSPNFSNEGDYLRKHIRSALVEDSYYEVQVIHSGKVWEQGGYWDSIDECIKDPWIKNRVEHFNFDQPKEEKIDEGLYCGSEVGTFLPSHSWQLYFQYPKINTSLESYIGRGRNYDKEISLSKYQACFETINLEMKNYANLTVDQFADEIGYGSHHGYALIGEYRLVGLQLGEDIEHFSFSKFDAGVSPYSWDQSDLWLLNKKFMGHRNNLPDDYFDLSDFGMVDVKPPSYMSFIFEIYTYTGGNHGMYTYETFNYELEKCKKIELRDIMSDKLLIEQGFELPSYNDALWINLLSSRLGDIWSVDLGMLPGYKDWSAQPWSTLNNVKQEDTYSLWSNSLSYSQLSAVSINDDGLTFSFQPYAVDCWACGWPEITISWGNLWDIFTWGNWEDNEDSLLYKDSIIQDKHLEEIEEYSNQLVSQYEISDLIYGSSYDFVYEYQDKKYFWMPRKITKQDNPTVYGLSGLYTEKDKKIVVKFTEVMNNIIGEDMFSYSENIEDITIPITFSKCLNKTAWNSYLSGDYCSLGYYSPKNNEIWVESDLYGYERDHVLIHELGHSIGLNHSSCIQTGLMSIKNNSEPIFFSEFEIALIKFLYDTFPDSDKKISTGMEFNDLTKELTIEIENLTPQSLFCPDELYTVVKEEN